MTQDEIIELARQAGCPMANMMPMYFTDTQLLVMFKAFAKLVAEKEREACWDIIFDYAGRDDITPEDESLLKHLADLIRARGQA
jgi:hypothetical protein